MVHGGTFGSDRLPNQASDTSKVSKDYTPPYPPLQHTSRKPGCHRYSAIRVTQAKEQKQAANLTNNPGCTGIDLMAAQGDSQRAQERLLSAYDPVAKRLNLSATRRTEQGANRNASVSDTQAAMKKSDPQVAFFHGRGMVRR